MGAAALGPRINVSCQAVVQILLVIGIGAWLSARRGLDRQALAAVSSVNWHALIPALMFSSIVGAVTPTNLLLLWPLMVLSLLHVAMGMLPALFLGWLCRLPKDMLFFTAMAASLPNCGNLPWLVAPTLIRYFTPADQVAAQIQYSTGLISVYTIIIVLITLTVPFLFKKPPETLVLPRTSSLVLPRNHSSVSLATMDGEEDSSDLQPHQQPDTDQQHHHHHHQQQQQQLQQDKDVHDQQQQQQKGQQPTRASSPGATAWVVPLSAADVKATTVGGDTVGRSNDAGTTDVTAEVDTGCLAFDGLQGTRELPALHHQQGQRQQQQQQQQQGHEFSTQPALGGLDSFSSHRSSSFLLSHTRQLFGSFSRSVSRGVNRGIRRSASFVQLVWSYPTGWQPQRRDQAHSAALSSRTEGAGAGAAQPRWLQRLRSLWAAVLAHPVVNLPLGATCVGIVCAAVGPVRGLLVNELAPLHWLWLGLSWVGAAAAPIATMQIGAELMQTAPTGASMHVSRRVQWTANTIAIVVKLVLVPLANVALLQLGGLSKLVPADDTVYQLLMLIEAAVPAAVTLLVCCSRVYPDIRPLSSMLFWQYVASLFTLPAFLVWFLYMLEL